MNNFFSLKFKTAESFVKTLMFLLENEEIVSSHGNSLNLKFNELADLSFSTSEMLNYIYKDYLQLIKTSSEQPKVLVSKTSEKYLVTLYYNKLIRGSLHQLSENYYFEPEDIESFLYFQYGIDFICF